VKKEIHSTYEEWYSYPDRWPPWKLMIENWEIQWYPEERKVPLILNITEEVMREVPWRRYSVPSVLFSLFPREGRESMPLISIQRRGKLLTEKYILIFFIWRRKILEEEWPILINERYNYRRMKWWWSNCLLLCQLPDRRIPTYQSENRPVTIIQLQYDPMPTDIFCILFY